MAELARNYRAVGVSNAFSEPSKTKCLMMWLAAGPASLWLPEVRADEYTTAHSAARLALVEALTEAREVYLQSARRL